MPLPTAALLDLISQAGEQNYIPNKGSLVANIQDSPQSAEQIHFWLSRNLPDRPHPAISRPVNWVRVIAITTTLLATGTFLAVAWPYILPVVQNRNVWAAISLIAILLFTSGHMFNHIRKVAYVAGDGKINSYTLIPVSKTVILTVHFLAPQKRHVLLVLTYS